MAKKNKKKLRNKNGDQVFVGKLSKSPAVFFKKIGIRNLSDNNLDKVFGKKGLKGINYLECHKTLPHAKLWWSQDFNRICLIADKLKELVVPSNSKVLDIGGGPGHIAFWLSSIWENCKITVADKFPIIGAEWAKEIDINCVSFIDSSMPELKGIDESQYDVVLISRVIGNNMSLSNIDNYSMNNFLKSQKGISIMQYLDSIAEGILRVLAPNGRVIIVDSWSSDRIFLVGKAFEKNGLYIDLDMFSPNISQEHSIIVFSTKNVPHLYDNALGLSTAISIDNGRSKFYDNAAESVKKIFETGRQLMLVEHFSNEHSVYAKDEIIEKDGLALFYRTTTAGARLAIITTSIDIKSHLEDFRQHIEKSVATAKIKILQKIFPN